MTQPPDPARLCERARALAEDGDAAGAAALFEQVLDLGDTPYRARAALGLAVVLDDAGDTAGARAADRAAVATGDPEYGPRAAYHLAVTCERAGDRAEAAPAWRTVVEFGNAAYLPPAHLALARIADDAGDFAAAREHWERAVATGDPEYGTLAAHDLAQRLLERGEPARAQRVLTAGLKLVDPGGAPYAHGRLAVALGIAFLDQAISAFRAALGDGPADPEVAPLATELLARTLPLRGRGEEAREAWRRGLADPAAAGQVRARLRRDFAADDEDPGDPADLWWEPVLEGAVADGTLPALAGEAFGALDHMYALLAVRRPGGAAAPADDGAERALADAVEVPGAYAWGPLLRESFAERLRLALGAEDAPAETRDAAPDTA